MKLVFHFFERLDPGLLQAIQYAHYRASPKRFIGVQL